MRQPAQRRKDGPKPKEKNANKKPAGRNNRPQPQRSTPSDKEGRAKDERSSVSLAAADIPTPLQQLLLNIFKTAFVLWPEAASSHEARDIKPASNQEEKDPSTQPTSQLIQTLKSHLYRRDFASAFADANDDLLRVYALRWSAGRALGYAGIFNTVLGKLCWRRHDSVDDPTSSLESLAGLRQHILCIGGGAGAEIAALAAILRRVADSATPAGDEESPSSSTTRAGNQRLEPDLTGEVSNLSLDGGHPGSDAASTEPTIAFPVSTRDIVPRLSVTAVDIADWNPVVNGLSEAIFADSVPSIKSCPAPLLSRSSEGQDRFTVSFLKEDVLSLSGEGLRPLLFPEEGEAQCRQGPSPALPSDPATSSDVGSAPTLVTLMFTLNELFSTSMPKTVSMLLKLTDLTRPGTILLVVDSPGSYSTVSIGSKADTSSNADKHAKPSERKYPMRFLLEHTLLSVAAGRWECILSDESRWFRRDRAALKYHIGEGIGLEDMRYQIHIYRRTTE